jgi:hypothetical protein
MHDEIKLALAEIKACVPVMTWLFVKDDITKALTLIYEAGYAEGFSEGADAGRNGNF